MTNYYELLEISKNATEDEIKKSYKLLAKKHHPDKGGDKETFQKIQEAYDTLSDKDKKQQYDNPAQNFMNMNNFAQNFPGAFNINLNNIFNTRVKLQDSCYNCKITFRDVYTGTLKKFILKRQIKCKNCKVKCDKCKGTGNINSQINLGSMIQIFSQPCDNCKGCGLIQKSENCAKCNFKGFSEEEKKVELKLPKGVEHGETYLFKGWGEQPTKDSDIPGDFIIRIEVENFDIFNRNKLNLHLRSKITLKESLIGKIINIPLFENSFDININTFGIINPNKEYIIFGKGLEDENGKKGDLYLSFEILYSNIKLSDENLEILKNVCEKINI